MLTSLTSFQGSFTDPKTRSTPTEPQQPCNRQQTLEVGSVWYDHRHVSKGVVRFDSPYPGASGAGCREVNC